MAVLSDSVRGAALRFAMPLALLGACADDPVRTQVPTVDPTQLVARYPLGGGNPAALGSIAGYAAFPHAVRLANGDVLVSWREGVQHMAPPSRIMLARYRLEGDSLRVVRTSVLLDTPEDEREAGLAQLSDGTVLANVFTGGFTSYDLDGEKWHLIVLRSPDGGETWPDTVRIDPAAIHTVQGKPFRWLATRGAVVERPNGELLMPVYGVVYGDRRHTTHVLRSTDGGRTWSYGALIARDRDQGSHYNETALLVDGDAVVAVFRSEDSYLRQAVSEDGGRTFRPARKLDVWGVPPHLLRLDDGRVLLSRGYRRGRMGVRYTLSTDGGVQWQPEVEGVLADDSDTEDCGYPSTVQLQDGSLFTVYYTTHRLDGALVTRIWGVRYRIPPLPPAG